MSSRQLPHIKTIAFISISFLSSPAAATTFTVTNLNDSGIGSLRQAIINANAAVGAATNTITFQSGLSGTLLTTGNLRISGKLNVIGPGADVLTLYSNGTTIFVINTGATVTLSGLKITHGFDGINNAGTLTVNNIISSENAASGIYSYGGNAVLTVNNSTLSDNSLPGIGMQYGGVVTVNDSTLSGNEKGGIYDCDSGGTLTVNRSTLSANQYYYAGGGICSEGTLTVRDSTLSNNSSTNSWGGGIYSRGQLVTLTGNTFSGNTARNGCGGGVYLEGATTLTFYNNTLSGNTASSGGGFCVGGNYVFKMTNNTVIGNTASSVGGGIYIGRGNLLSLGNTVVAGNTAPTAPEIKNDGSFLSAGHNLFGVGGVLGSVGITVGSSDMTLPGLIGTAVGPLANNGGPTLTHLPVAGSPMINAGDNSLILDGVTTDQRGYGPRIVGNTVDIGAVEAGALPPDQSLIEHYYQAILGRSSDATGLAEWRSEAERARNLGLSTPDVFRVLANVFFTSAEYLNRNTSDSQYITDLYLTFFNRSPDSSGLTYWMQQLTAGLPRSVVFFSFLFSTEFESFMQGLFGTTTVRSELATVGDFYRGFLNRLPDDSGFAFWLGRFRVAQCTNAAAVRVEVDSISSQFLAGTEYTSRQRSDRDFIADLYYTFLRRGGDLAGFNYWVNQLGSGMTRDQVRQAFVNASEFQARVTQIINDGCMP